MASHVGHSDILALFSVAENSHPFRVKFEMLEKMLQPCGPAPQRATEEETQ
jgi:splicing factor 3B subunit 5